MSNPESPGGEQSALDKLKARASRKFSDWSVEIFIAIVVVGLGVAVWFARPYFEIFNH